MSSDTINPISPSRFAAALQDLPLDALHAKIAELQNSTTHLRSSNSQMLPFAEDGDQDCKDAMIENLVVIGRVNERIQMIRAEIQGRGMPLPDRGVASTNGPVVNGAIDGHPAAASEEEGEHAAQAPRPAPSGRLTDEELRRQLEAQMAEEEEDGVHL